MRTVHGSRRWEIRRPTAIQRSLPRCAAARGRAESAASTHHEPFMIHCLVASICPAAKCLISADTKCDAKRSATFPGVESVTSPSLYALVMISNKAKVVDHYPRLSHPGNAGAFDNEAGKTAGCLDVRIDRVREFYKVILLKRRLWSHVQDGMRGIEVVFDPCIAPSPVGAFAQIRPCSKPPSTSIKTVKTRNTSPPEATNPKPPRCPYRSGRH
jgi:hypothetical protein